MNIKRNNYIQLRKFNEGSKFPFYLPNLNKESNLNIQGFKKKLKFNLNLEQILINQRNNYNFNNNHNYRTRNKYFLSPANEKLKKSESGFFIKTPMNSSLYDLNKNLNIKDSEDFDNNNLYSTYIKKNINNFSKKIFHKRKKSPIKK